MEKSAAEAEDLDSRTEQFAQIGVRGTAGEPHVAACGQHHQHAAPAPHGAQQRFVERGRRQEIGRRDAQRVPRLLDELREEIGQRRARTVFARPCDLKRGAGQIVRRRGRVKSLRQRFAAFQRPVGREEPLQVVDGFALDAQVFVAPAPQRVAVEVTFGDVDTAHESRAAVDDGDLGVVAPVGARREPWEPQRRVGAHLDSCAAEPPHEPFGKFPRTDGVVEQPHLHAGTRLADEDVGDGVADAVVGEDVVGEMDVAAGTLQGGDQRGEGFAAVVELFHAVAVADARRTAVPQHPLDAGRRPAVGGRHVPHGFAVSRQQVEQAAADRQKHDGQQPCDRYYGRLLLPQYGCRRGDCQQEICGEEKIHDQGRFLVRGILCAKKYLEIKKLLFIFV